MPRHSPRAADERARRPGWGAARAGSGARARRRWRGPAALACGLVLAAGSGARAQAPCTGSEQAWVAVAFAGEAWDAALRQAVLADLRAGLRLKGIDACEQDASGAKSALAQLTLRAAERDRISVAIEVHDALTEKRLSRELDLRALAPDARALAIAAASDELLRASWTELALQDAPRPARPAPEVVTRAVRSSLSPARVGSLERALGVGAAFEQHGGGASLLGGDLYLEQWLGERLGLELGLGLREGLRRDAPHGTVDTRALGGALALLFALLPREQALGLWGRLGLALSSVRVQGRARQGAATGGSGAGLDLHARAGLSGLLALGARVALRLTLELGLPLRAVRAADAGRAVTATTGVQGHAGLGAEVRF